MKQLLTLTLLFFLTCPAPQMQAGILLQQQNIGLDELPLSKADDLYSRAKHHLNSNYPDSALTVAHKALEQYEWERQEKQSFVVRQLIGSIYTKVGNFEQAESYLTVAGKFFAVNKHAHLLKENYILLGVLFERMGKYHGSIEQYTMAIELSKGQNDTKSLGICYNNLGVIHEVLGDYSTALSNYFLSLNYKSQTGDESGKSSVYNNIGNIYKIKGDLSVALEYHRKALIIRRGQNDWLGIAMSLNNIATIYKSKNDLDKAMATLSEAQKFAETSKDTRLVARIYSNMASIFVFRREFKEAMSLYQKAIKIFEEQSDYLALANCYNIYGALLYELQNPQSAIIYLRKSLTVANSTGTKALLKETYGGLATCYAAIRQFDSAFIFQSKFSSILDSIASKTVKDNLSKTQLQNEKEQQNQEILQLQREQKDANLALINSQNYLEKLQFEHLSTIKITDKLKAKNDSDNAVLTVLTAQAEQYRLTSENNKNKIELLEKNKELAEIQYQQQQLLTILGGSVAVLLLLITGLLNRTNSNNKKFTAQLQEKNQKILDKAELLEERNVEILKQKTNLADLASEITLKNAELENSNWALHTIIKERNDLLSIATHDLKNSLSGIKMLSGILASTPEQLDDKEIREFGTLIRGSSEHLFHVIKGLSDISTIEQGDFLLNNEPVYCSDIISNILQQHQLSAQQKDIAVAMYAEPDLFIHTDPKAYFTIIDNLIANAVMFSPRGSEVDVRVFPETDEQGNQAVVCTVKDSGPGFTEQDVKRLYTTFAKLSAQPTGGEAPTGLGLAISKKLAEITRGSLLLQSTSDSGSVFRLSYPQHIEDAVAENYGANAAPDSEMV